VALIEDCAHCYFGNAGERPVGTWGDLATASLSKFFPIPEGGILASATRPISALPLSPQGFKAQVKSWVDVLELATQYGRLAGINWALAGLFGIKNAFRRANANVGSAGLSAADMMRSCDMERRSQGPLATATTLARILPREPIIAKRRRNFAIYARHFANLGDNPELQRSSGEEAIPYVFPLWVEDPDRVYHALRAQGLAVFRWDRLWPGTPQLAGDVGPSWSRHVLQLLCHQDLSATDINRTALATLNLLSNPSAPAPAVARQHLGA
jgi:dTDP-4-amino-4,6-dideoxygalactose transaminase